MRSPRLAIGLMLSPAFLAGGGVDTPDVASRIEVVRVDVAVTDRNGTRLPT